MKIRINVEKDVVVSEIAPRRITLIPARGPAGADGAQGPQGPAGADGATPVRGVDYWTAADQAAMAQAAGEAALAAVAPALEAKAPAILEEAVPGDLVSINDGADGGKVKALTIGIEPAQAGSGDPSPDNVRPITGRTGASVRVTGANLWGGTLMRDSIKAAIPNATIDDAEKIVSFASNATITQNFTSACGLTGKFKALTQYTIILTIYKNTGASTNMRVNYTDGTYANVPGLSSAGVKETVLLVTSANKTVDRISKVNGSGTTRLYYDESGMFEGALTAEDFAAYAGAAHPVSWETEAGTVYGGSVTLNPDGSADVSACPYYASYAGEALAGPWVSSMDVYSAGATPTTGAQVVDLGGEKTVTHVPAAWTPPMLTHLGANSAWADCGPIEALTYPADTKLYVDGQTKATRSLIAGIETSMTASKDYSTGDLLIVGDTLYKVAAAIASGATFTPGTNITPTTVAEQLMLLANA